MPGLNTLYLTDRGGHLSHRQGALVWHPVRGKPQKLPLKQIDQVVILNPMEINLNAVKACLDQGVLFSIEQNNRIHGFIPPHQNGRLDRMRLQFRIAEDKAATLKLAKSLVIAKIQNSITLLKRYARHHQLDHFQTAAQQMQTYIRSLKQSEDLDQIRGWEGSAARDYFQSWRHSFGAAWQFSGRKRRPPPDPINALLSFGYTLLYSNMLSFLHIEGLHPDLGFLHSPEQNSQALVSDLIEPFRAPIIDSIVLNWILNERIKPSDFEQDGQSCRLSEELRKKFIRELEKKFSAKVAQNINYRQALYHQVKHLCQWFEQPDQPLRAFTLQ